MPSQQSVDVSVLSGRFLLTKQPDDIQGNLFYFKWPVICLKWSPALCSRTGLPCACDLLLNLVILASNTMGPIWDRLHETWGWDPFPLETFLIFQRTESDHWIPRAKNRCHFKTGATLHRRCPVQTSQRQTRQKRPSQVWIILVFMKIFLW